MKPTDKLFSIHNSGWSRKAENQKAEGSKSGIKKAENTKRQNSKGQNDPKGGKFIFTRLFPFLHITSSFRIFLNSHALNNI